jgi:hypothetical protein
MFRQKLRMKKSWEYYISSFPQITIVHTKHLKYSTHGCQGWYNRECNKTMRPRIEAQSKIRCF